MQTLLLSWHILVFLSVLHRKMLIGNTHSSQFMEWQNLVIRTLKLATCAPNILKNCRNIE